MLYLLSLRFHPLQSENEKYSSACKDGLKQGEDFKLYSIKCWYLTRKKLFSLFNICSLSRLGPPGDKSLLQRAGVCHSAPWKGQGPTCSALV